MWGDFHRVCSAEYGAGSKKERAWWTNVQTYDNIPTRQNFCAGSARRKYKIFYNRHRAQKRQNRVE